MTPSPARAVAAVDLGATSGRIMIGRLDGGRIDLELVSRFPNGPVERPDGLHWDFAALCEHILDGLAEAVRREPAIESIGIDSWAVDYGLLRDGELLAEPFHYRDGRTADGVARVHEVTPFEELYRRSGLQFLPFNTLYQLTADDRLDDADTVLLIPDLLGHLLTGARVAERTNASTTGLLDVRTREWDTALAERLGIRPSILPALVDPGTVIGRLRPEIAARIGRDLPVVAVASHDTASAVLAVPMRPASAVYISCGTWGLVGVETLGPDTSDAARAANFTNEGGVFGTVRFLRNVMGLWLLSESVRAWERQGDPIDLPQLLAEAEAVVDDIPVFDVDDPRFATPGDLPQRIVEWYAERSLPVPVGRAATTRAIIESLAQAFADTAREASALAGIEPDAVHIVGGGSLNALLCRRTAQRSGLPVVAGPVEATALGNVLMQLSAAGAVEPDAAAMRSLVAASTEPVRYEPQVP